MTKKSKKFLIISLVLTILFMLCGLASCGQTVKSISIKGETYYMVGEEYKDGDAKLTVVYSDGKRENISVTEEMMKGFDTATAGNKTVVVEYKGKVVTLDITVSDLYVASIAVMDESVNEYCMGIGYTDGDAKLVVLYTDGTSETVDVTESMLSGFNTSSVGDVKITVEYARLSTSYSINVRYPRVTAISVNSVTQTLYRVGDTFEGATLTVSYENGTSEIVDVTDTEMVQGFDSATTGEKTLQITYRGETISYAINVRPTIQAIAVQDMDCAVGDEVAGTLVAICSDESTEEIPLTADMLTGFDTYTVGDKKVTVNYQNFTTSFKLRVAHNLADITDVVDGTYKIQVEDTKYVNTSRILPLFNRSVFSTISGAEGTNINLEQITYWGNAVGVRFYVEKAGAYHLGMRAQTRWNNTLNQVFNMYINGVKSAIQTNTQTYWGTWVGPFETNATYKGCANVSGTVCLNAGVNEFVFESITTTYFPAVDYFTVTNDKYFGENVTLEVAGNATVNLGGVYKDGLTLTVKDGGETVASVPVDATMISGLDTSKTGDCPVIINYLGAQTTTNITVVDEQYTLTLTNGTFEGGATTATLKYGDAIPAITWNVTKVLGYLVNNKAYADISNLRITEDTTIKAYEGASAQYVLFAQDTGTKVQYNSGMSYAQWNYGMPTATYQGTKAQGGSGVTTSNSEFNPSDSVRDAFTYADYTGGALSKGFTHTYTRWTWNTSYKNVNCAVFVTFTNNLDVTLKDVVYSTGAGCIYLGDVGANETVRGGIVMTVSEQRTTHIFWSNEDISNPNFTVSTHFALK